MDQQLNLDLFEAVAAERTDGLGPGAVVLRGFAAADTRALLASIEGIVASAPLRHLITPGGHRMSVAMTNCGSLGWVSDGRGYRYAAADPLSGASWPPIPAVLLGLASSAAARAGFEAFAPDACLVNHYEPGARLSLHQDKDELALDAPIVSVSLGLPAVFLFGGETRAERPVRVPVRHGDVVVWGGASRLRFHGVAPIKDGHHEVLGRRRINLTFRKAK